MTKLEPLFCLLFALAGCAHSSEPSYFNLAPVSGVPMPQILTAVKLQRPNLAHYLDRPDFVEQPDALQLRIDEADRWAEPVDTMVLRLLAADLQQRLPNSIIETEDSAAAPPARFTVALTLDQFNRTDGNKVSLQGTMTLTDETRFVQPQSMPVDISTSVAATPHATVEELSRMVGDIATVITLQIATIILHEYDQKSDKTQQDYAYFLFTSFAP